jgi:hypothetical protein
MTRPNGVLEKLAALMGDGICARLRFGVPIDALSLSCVFLSVVAFWFLPTEADYAAAWLFAMGCSPHMESQESKPQHPARLAKVVAIDGESDGQRKMGGAAEAGPNQQAPVLETFAAKNPEADIGMEERHEISPIQ